MYAYAASESISDDERERLILEHLPQVRLIARRIQERLPDNVALEDLVSTGVIGLISAIDNFDPSHNVKLKTYAEYKIRGAILDSLRGLDWAPRQKAPAGQTDRGGHRRTPNSASSAPPRRRKSPRNWTISIEEYHEWLVEIRGLNIASLEYTAGRSREGPAALHRRRRGQPAVRAPGTVGAGAAPGGGHRRPSRTSNAPC